MIDSLSTTLLDGHTVKQSLSRLRTGQTEIAAFVENLFTQLDGHRANFAQSETRLREERQRLAAERLHLQTLRDHDTQQLKSQLATLENERATLETELTELRRQNAELVASIENQKLQMDEERVEWTGELCQLRRILDKQSQWLSERAVTPAKKSNKEAGLARAANAATVTTTASIPAEGPAPPTLEVLSKPPAAHRVRENAGPT